MSAGALPALNSSTQSPGAPPLDSTSFTTTRGTPTQAPAPLQTRFTPQDVPAGVNAVPQTPSLQVRAPQSPSAPGQVAAARHSTQWPAPSHSREPSQLVPAGRGAAKQPPVAGSQAPLSALHPSAGVPATQLGAPGRQASPRHDPWLVHRSPSSQAAPSGAPVQAP